MSKEISFSSIGSWSSDVEPIETKLSRVGSDQSIDSPSEGSEVGSSGLPEEPILEGPGEGPSGQLADGTAGSSQRITPENCRSSLR